MANDLELKLILSADGKQLKSVTRDAEGNIRDLGTASTKAGKNISKGMTKAGKDTQSLSTHIAQAKTAFLAFVAVTGATILVADLIKTNIEFDKLRVSLETIADGKSVEILGRIREIAAETPASVQELTNAFIKLRNFGLDPSKEAIVSYGNTASALGKDLTQMIEAVADAATGEFERLKEFGIKTKVQGDNVSFIFQGVTTTVKKNSKEIEGYLKSLGDTKFSGQWAREADTLGGALSNAGDAWDNLKDSIIGQKGAGAISKALRSVGNFFNFIAQNAKDSKEEVSGLNNEVGNFTKSFSILIQIAAGGVGILANVVDTFELTVKTAGTSVQVLLTGVLEGIAVIEQTALNLPGILLGHAARERDTYLLRAFRASKESSDALVKDLKKHLNEPLPSTAIDDWSRRAVDALRGVSGATLDTGLKLKDFVIKQDELKAETDGAAAATDNYTGSLVDLGIASNAAANIFNVQGRSLSELSDNYLKAASAAATLAKQESSVEDNKLKGSTVTHNFTNAEIRAAGGSIERAIGIRNKGSAATGIFDVERLVTMGFASGGSFMVGGVGGTDSQTVAFKASPDERVTIETPEQQNSRGGVNINIDNLNLTEVKTGREFIRELEDITRKDPANINIGESGVVPG